MRKLFSIKRDVTFALLGQFDNFKRSAGLVFRVIYTNPRTYIFSFLLPLILSFALFWLWNHYDTQNSVLPPMLINFISISIFLTSFYLGIYIIEWRKKNFLKIIKVGGVNKMIFLVVMVLLNASLVFASIIINIIFYNIYTLIPILNLSLPLLSNLYGYIWVLFIIGMLLLIVFMTLFYGFLATAFTKRNMSFAIVTIVTLFLMVFSDVFLNPTMSNNSLVFVVIGYFCPARYYIWFNMMIVSYQYLDPLGMTQIIQNYLTVDFICFTQIWQVIIGMIVFMLAFGFLAFKFFNWGMKG